MSSKLPRALPLCALIVAATVACGSTPQPGAAPWSATHPDPRGMHFTDAQGLCAITVRYPDEAPGEIDWKDDHFIQRTRSSTTGAGGPVVAHSGDWTIHQPSAGMLLLVTPSAIFDYRNGSNCGSNSAAPT